MWEIVGVVLSVALAVIILLGVGFIFSVRNVGSDSDYDCPDDGH